MNHPQSEFTSSDYNTTAQEIQGRTPHQPRIGLILGSGLGGLADSIEQADVIPYDELGYWPRSHVLGHKGRLVIGQLEGQTVLTMQGRAHFYEGYSMTQVTYPIRVMKALGIEVLIVTNAAGGLNPAFTAGDLMLITDHLNFPGMGGYSPLRGPNDEALGPRFPDMSKAYNRALRQLALEVAADADIPLQQGVYCYVAGPSFETPAEIRLLRLLGGSAVGMSTAPEVVVASHAGIRVLGISGISNMTISDPDVEATTDHEEVLEIGQVIVPKLTALIRGVLRRLGDTAQQ